MTPNDWILVAFALVGLNFVWLNQRISKLADKESVDFIHVLEVNGQSEQQQIMWRQELVRRFEALERATGTNQ